MPVPSRLRSLWFAALACLFPAAGMAADDLLETLAQKGILTMEEYEKLKAQRKTAPAVVTDDGFRIAAGDNGGSIQVGTPQQLDVAA